MLARVGGGRVSAAIGGRPTCEDKPAGSRGSLGGKKMHRSCWRRPPTAAGRWGWGGMIEEGGAGCWGFGWWWGGAGGGRGGWGRGEPQGEAKRRGGGESRARARVEKERGLA